MISKAARGEAISIRYGIPGFVDWESVFGLGAVFAQMYRLEFCSNPCAGGLPAEKEKEKKKKKKKKDNTLCSYNKT